jgi:hypothetical protein
LLCLSALSRGTFFPQLKYCLHMWPLFNLVISLSLSYSNAYRKHHFRFNGMFHVVASATVMEILCLLQMIGILHFYLFI